MPPELLTLSKGMQSPADHWEETRLEGLRPKSLSRQNCPPPNDEHPNRLGGDFGSGIAVQLVFGLASFRHGCFGHNGSRLFDQLFAEKAFRRCMVNALFCWAGLLVGLP